jgi:hypothetical protein
MEAQHYDRLLHHIAAAAQDYDLERAYTQLDAYITGELAGEPVQVQWPAVAFFLATDAHFAEVYTALRQHALHVDTELAEAEPDEPVNLAALTALVTGQLTLTSDDIARPLPEPPDPADEERAALQMLLPYWQQHLPQRGGLFMSASAPELPPIELPEQAQPTWLDLVLSQEASGVALDGRVRPLPPDLPGCPVYLYRIELQPEPVVTQTYAGVVDRFGHFELLDLPPGRYVLALLIDDAIVGATWLDL